MLMGEIKQYYLNYIFYNAGMVILFFFCNERAVFLSIQSVDHVGILSGSHENPIGKR